MAKVASCRRQFISCGDRAFCSFWHVDDVNALDAAAVRRQHPLVRLRKRRPSCAVRNVCCPALSIVRDHAAAATRTTRSWPLLERTGPISLRLQSVVEEAAQR